MINIIRCPPYDKTANGLYGRFQVVPSQQKKCAAQYLKDDELCIIHSTLVLCLIAFIIYMGTTSKLELSNLQIA